MGCSLVLCDNILTFAVSGMLATSLKLLAFGNALAAEEMGKAARAVLKGR